MFLITKFAAYQRYHGSPLRFGRGVRPGPELGAATVETVSEHISPKFQTRTSGFSFVARQQRISAEDEHFYIDLVFYNYILKCFVLVDLKVGKLTHQDIGQMDLYVRYYEDQVKQTSDNPTIGLILCTEKKETIVKYSVSLPNINYTCQPKKS